VNTELTPGENLEEAFQRPDSARQGNETVRQVGHLRLALVHRGYHDEVADSGVGCLLLDQLLGDDPGDVAPVLLHRVRQLAHDSNARSPIHQLDLLRGQELAEPSGRGPVFRSRSRVGAAEYANPIHLPIVLHRCLGAGGGYRDW
jgi:hypothetical protein